MAHKKKERTVPYDKALRLNLTLTPELNQQLNKFVLEIANRRGEIPHSIRTKVLRAALKEWLSNHGSDLDIYERIE